MGLSPKILEICILKQIKYNFRFKKNTPIDTFIYSNMLYTVQSIVKHFKISLEIARTCLNLLYLSM